MKAGLKYVQRPEAAESVVTIRALSVRLGSARVLRDVSLNVAAGEIVTIIGRNGSGKSTLLRSLIGAVTPDAGTIGTMPGLRVGYVPQSLALDPTLPMTVTRFLNLPRRAGRDSVAQALTRTGTDRLAKRQLADLSGGQRQRVLLARALLNRPQLLLLDEPTQGLDAEGTAAFYRAIEAARRDLGCAVLMVSHDLGVVMSASDRIVLLDGTVVVQGSAAEVASSDAYRALIGDVAPEVTALRSPGDTPRHAPALRLAE
ncbi:metal ABC transporter ATP-binding protein [Chachezhania antarctica]|uniref:metal ABC transporter ATP-binding protein n=1 Tax=Chachezhania antarctica TaxID=2340860 RepID=UPI001F09EFC4|nr:metal ABC transporter ATP-binding protein [Chachezhania antarctica]